MTKQTINIGQSPNDKSGDPLRTAFTKVNANFTELYANLSSYLPNPAGNQGLFLTNNGTTLSWAPTVSYTQSATPPSSPNADTLWYDEVSGRVYTWYNYNWVDASPPLSDYKNTPPTSPQGAIGDIEGQWSADFNYYYYCSSSFVGNNAPIWRRVAFDSSNNWSVYAGGGSGSLPSNSTGYLYNNGSGTLNWINNTQGYTLPQATTSTLGGVIVDGTTIQVNSGVISTAPQVNANWTATSGVSAILNKPTIITPVQSDWNTTDNTQLSYIKNKPSIPSIGHFTFTNDQITVSDNSNITLLTNAHSWSFNSNGSLTFPDASVQYTAYTGTAFPSQTGNSGKYLTTNGSGTLSWTASTASWPVTNTNGASGPTNLEIGQNASAGSAINSIALGTSAGGNTTGNNVVLIGQSTRGVGNEIISIGHSAGQNYSGNEAIFIGHGAGQSGSTKSANGVIVLNATGSALSIVNSQNNSFYVAPIRTDATPNNILFYNTTSNEVTYGAMPSYPSIPGPYAGDTIAASHGIAIGQPYYQPSGQVFVRLV
jgi:hypothetical protein